MHTLGVSLVGPFTVHFTRWCSQASSTCSLPYLRYKRGNTASYWASLTVSRAHGKAQPGAGRLHASTEAAVRSRQQAAQICELCAGMREEGCDRKAARLTRGPRQAR